MEIELPVQLLQFVESQVQSGLYTCPSEVVVEALLLLQQRIASDDLIRNELRGAVAVGVEQANNGQILDADKVFSQIRERFQGGLVGQP